MKVEAVKVYGYCCPNKHVIMAGGKPVLIVNSSRHASECISYIEGLSSDDDLEKFIGDKKSVGILKKVKNMIKENEHEQ